MNHDTGTRPDTDDTSHTGRTADGHDEADGAETPSQAAQEAARLRQENAARRDAGSLLAEATRLSQEAAEEADRLLESAQETAERLVAEARERAEALVTQARQESQELRDEAALEVAGAREDLEHQRARARAEVTAELREEVAALRARTEGLVEELRGTLGELGGLLGGAKSTVEHVLRTATDLDDVGRRIAAHDQRSSSASDTPSRPAPELVVAAPAVEDEPPTPAGPESDSSDDRPEQSPDLDRADAPTDTPVDHLGDDPGDHLAQPFSMDLEHLGADRTDELSEQAPRSTTVEQEQRPLGWLFRGV